MMKSSKDNHFKNIENFKALIKCYTANAAYQDMKTVVRKSNFHYLKHYLNLLFTRVELYGQTLGYTVFNKPVFRGINCSSDIT